MMPVFIFFYLLDVLICCQAAVSDLITDLGSNVIINCDLDENDVYWILLKTADPPTEPQNHRNTSKTQQQHQNILHW